MIRVAHRWAPGVVCRVLSGQRWPEVSREQGLEYASSGIKASPARRRIGRNARLGESLQGRQLVVPGVRAEEKCLSSTC